MRRCRNAIVWLALILAPVALTTAACGEGGAQATSPAEGGGGGGRGGGRGGGGGAVPVTVANVVQKPMPRTLQLIGSVEASHTVAIRAQVTGGLTTVNFKEGDDVREGAVLFELDRRPLEAALAQAQANLARDEAQSANSNKEAQRAADLAQRGIATREQVETATSGATALQATVAADRAALENARVQLEYATIKAPISGRTGALMVHAGNLVRANDTTPLVVINQITPVNVTFSIPEAQMPMVKQYLARGAVPVSAGAPADDAAPSKGRITFMDNAVDPTTGTIKAKASFENSDRQLWPGQFVNVTLTLATDPNAIVVPTSAVQSGQQGSYVFVVKADRTVEIRPVEVGRAIGDETIVNKGLTPGDTVVTDGQLRLVAGSTVSVKQGGSSQGEGQ